MPVRRIGLLGFDSIQALDLAGPADAFGSDALAAPEYSPNGEPPYEVVVIGLTSRRFTASSGLEFHARHVVPTNVQLDTLIVPGGSGLRRGDLADRAAEWIVSRASRIRRIASVCTGIYGLAPTGLLGVKLDALGYYDDFEVNRVVEVQFYPKAKQGDLVAALTPVVDRLMRRYGVARATFNAGQDANDGAAAKKAKDELDALTLFKTDMGAFTRLYTFLSQIFDYGNTDIEKRAIFYKVLIPLLDFGGERETIDLSKVRLTHHTVKNLGRQAMPLAGGEYPKLEPITEAGSGAVQEKQRAYLNEIIERVNDLFEGELTDQDKLVYVNNVLKGKLLESATLRAQAANNTKEQFANSPDLKSELMGAIIGALDAHNVMSSQALASESVREGLKDLLLNYAQLYESLRQQAS